MLATAVVYSDPLISVGSCLTTGTRYRSRLLDPEMMTLLLMVMVPLSDVNLISMLGTFLMADAIENKLIVFLSELRWTLRRL